MSLQLLMARARMNHVAAVGGGDPHWSDVVSLLNFSDPIGSSTFTDEVGRVWSVQTGTPQNSASGLVLPGASWITTPRSTDFDIPIGVDATIDIGVTLSALAIQYLFTTRLGGLDGVGLRAQSDGSVLLFDTGFGVNAQTQSGVLAIGAYAFVRCRYVGAMKEIWVNGTHYVTSARNGYAAALFDAGIGGSNNTGDFAVPLRGTVRMFRFTKGVARPGDEVPPWPLRAH